MDLPTYTNIWRIEKRLYKLYDFRLPMPLPVGTFGVALGVFAIWVVLLSILNAPFTFGNGWHLVLWVVPPGVITVLATRPVIEGKRLTELLISQARFLTEARVYTRLAPEYEPDEARVVVRVWHRHPDAGPLPASGRRRGERAEATPETDRTAVGELPTRPSPDSAPPLVGVAAPVPDLLSGQDAGPVPEEESEHTVPGAAAGTEEVPADTRPPEDAPDTRGVTRRVLNYFGIALEPVAPVPSRGRGDGSDEHVRGSERDEPGQERDGEEWISGLRAHSGRPPVGLSSRAAHEVGDTGAPSRAEVDEATGGPESEEEAGAPGVDETAEVSGGPERVRERRRAEEVMAAPEPEAEESAPARRLRGRVQGIRVARELDERRSEGVRERAPQDPPSGRARGTALPADEPPRPPRRRGRPHAAPWELDEPRRDGGAVPEAEDGPADRAGLGDLSDYAERYAAATGRSAVPETPSTPWLPPAASAPKDTADTAREADPDTEDGADTPDTAVASGGAAAPPEPDVPDSPDSPEPPTGTDLRLPAGAPPELDHGTGEQEAMPVRPSHDHGDRGTGWNEHMSVLDQHLSKADTPAPPRPRFADALRGGERDPKAADPAQWFDDGKRRHPDQPKVGDRGNPVIPASELREESAAESEESADTAVRPDDSGGADRTHGGAPAEVPEAESSETGAPGATGDVGDSKPPTQLDHGTGELVSFAEVRGEARGAAADRAAPRSTVGSRDASDGAPASRRTTADLEEAEAAALARRRADARRDPDPDPDPDPDSGSGSGSDGRPAPVLDPRANRSLADVLTEEGTASPTTRAGDDRAATGAGSRTGTDSSAGTDPDASDGHPGGDPHDGVFHRVAQNARRLGHLFGQPVPGEEPEPPRREEPEPPLELDHGTGEQERLGEAPDGGPDPRPVPTEPEPREGDTESGGTRGWRRLAKVVTGGAAPVRSDLPASDIARLRTPLPEPRSLVVLGCTGGAGQTVTSLMIGHTLAAHRDEPVVAVDVNPGPNGLSRRVGAQAPETLTALLANADEVDDHARMRDYTSRASTGLEVVQTLDDPYVQTLDDRDYGQLAELLGRFYAVTLLDPAATGVARALPVADSLVLVAPANADAERAVSMTFEWLDGNGYGALRANSVLVVNGVSKRSLADVDAAERVARGRCRAIVRVPWDDHLGSSYTRIDVGALRPATKRAHGALGGVLVNSLTRS